MKLLHFYMIIAVILSPSLSCAEHSQIPIKYEFVKTVSSYDEAIYTFSLPKDAEVYFSITANVLPSETTTYLLNFQKKCDNYSVTFGKFVDIDSFGEDFGPFALEAGEYSIKTSVNTTTSTTYHTTVNIYSQELPNDTEPNNKFPDQVQELGQMISGSNVPGHIGYSCRSSYTDSDNFKFQVADSDNYYFKINHDEFEEQCLLNFSLSDGMRPIASYLRDVNGTVFGPYKLEKGVNYYWDISLSLCQSNLGWFYGGAYDIEYSTSSQTTEPFSVDSLIITPSSLFYLRDSKVNTIVTNKTGNFINNVNLEFIVKRLSDNIIISKKQYFLSLLPNQKIEKKYDLSELVGGQQIINRLKEGKYSLTARAQQSELGHVSTQYVYFDFYKEPIKVLGAIKELLLNNKGK